MNKEQMDPYQEIDIVHMLRSILKAWKKILIAMLACAVLMGIFSYYKSAGELETQEQEGQQAEKEITAASSEAEILEASGLEEKAADEVLYYTNKYYYNQKQYDRQLSYLQDSILMQMDPNRVWTITLYYDLAVPTSDLSANTESADTMVAASYAAKIANDDIYAKIATELGVDIDSSYFAEVITISSLDNLSEAEDVTIISGKEDMKIVIRYSDQAGCETIAQMIKEQIEASEQEVTAEVGEHTITLAGEREEMKSDPELLDEQKNAVAALGNLSDNVISARTNIETSEEEVFNQLLTYYEAQDAQKASEIQGSLAKSQDGGAEAADETITDTGNEEIAATPSVSKKYVALGLILGAFLVAAWEACKYFFSDTLKQAKDLEKGYGLAVYDSRDQAVIDFVLSNKKEKEGYQTICTISSGEQPARNAEVLQRLMAADAVMLKEKVGVSRHKEIITVLDLCGKMEKPVIGAIVEM